LRGIPSFSKIELSLLFSCLHFLTDTVTLLNNFDCFTFLQASYKNRRLSVGAFILRRAAAQGVRNQKSEQRVLDDEQE
jgi:hypothetical protein